MMSPSVSLFLLVFFWCGPFFFWSLYWWWGMWDHSFPTKDQTHTPCIGRWSPTHWPTREVPSPNIYQLGPAGSGLRVFGAIQPKHWNCWELRGQKVTPALIQNRLLVIERRDFPGGSPADAGDMSSIPGREDPLEKEMVTHSSIFAWKSHGRRNLGDTT